MLGLHYTSSAIVEPRQQLPSLEDISLVGEPGTRAPHLWIERAGRRLSTLDLFGQRFVLLAAQEGEAWLSAADTIAAQLGLDLALYQAGLDFSDQAGTFCTAYGLTSQGAVLVRPDGYVGWRAEDGEEQRARTLARVFAQLLCRPA